MAELYRRRAEAREDVERQQAVVDFAKIAGASEEVLKRLRLHVVNVAMTADFIILECWRAEYPQQAAAFDKAAAAYEAAGVDPRYPSIECYDMNRPRPADFGCPVLLGMQVIDG